MPNNSLSQSLNQWSFSWILAHLESYAVNIKENRCSGLGKKKRFKQHLGIKCLSFNFSKKIIRSYFYQLWKVHLTISKMLWITSSRDCCSLGVSGPPELAETEVAPELVEALSKIFSFMQALRAIGASRSQDQELHMQPSRKTLNLAISLF